VATPKPVRVPTRRLSASQRAVRGAGVASSLALGLLTAHIFAPSESCQIAALFLLGGALVAAWAAVLTWRIPIYGRSRLVSLAILWVLGIGLSVCLVLVSTSDARGLLWQRSVQWLALTLSLAIGALFLRALLRVRTSPLSGRLLSLVSPFAVLALILILALTRT